ncbi:MAG: hypothetical protein K0Q46_3701 [Rhodococcus erythropolis]|jgi:hypothetical protein|nr:hypothetical protein [Rhodococcus erythropolis]
MTVLRVNLDSEHRIRPHALSLAVPAQLLLANEYYLLTNSKASPDETLTHVPS